MFGNGKAQNELLPLSRSLVEALCGSLAKIWQDDLEYQKLYWERDIQRMIREVQIGAYRFRPMSRSYIPKRGGRLRPITHFFGPSFAQRAVQGTYGSLQSALSPILMNIYLHSQDVRMGELGSRNSTWRSRRKRLSGKNIKGLRE